MQLLRSFLHQCYIAKVYYVTLNYLLLCCEVRFLTHTSCSHSGCVAQFIEQLWSKFGGHGFESQPGQSFSLSLCGPISVPRANAQMGYFGNLLSKLEPTPCNYLEHSSITATWPVYYKTLVMHVFLCLQYSLMNSNHLGEWSYEKDCNHWW